MPSPFPGPPTYSLRRGESGVPPYYATISAFADEVLGEGHRRLEEVVARFLEFEGRRQPAEQRLPVTRRSGDEAMLELLNLGTLWRTYGGNALRLPDLPATALAHLAEWRRQYDCLKPGLDRLRGALATPLLDIDETTPVSEDGPTWADFTHLLQWLAATGEFDREQERYAEWHAFMHARAVELAREDPSSTRVRDAVRAVVAYAAWFERRSLEVLGAFTRDVQHYLTSVHPKHHGLEDVVLTGRRRVEYHLNMIAAEVLNRVYRPAFLATERKGVVVPACLRRKSEGECLATVDDRGLHCQACDPGCRVHQLTRLSERTGLTLFVFPHTGSFSRWAGQLGHVGSVGIVGITCAINLLAGGWEAAAAGIPVQCVLLDSCGCQRHWDAGDQPTDFSMAELLRVLGVRA